MKYRPGHPIHDIIRDVAELPDRTSPEDQPDMMLVTADELEAILDARLHENRQHVTLGDNLPVGVDREPEYLKQRREHPDE